MQEYDKVLELYLPHDTLNLNEFVKTLTEPRILRGTLLDRSEWKEPLKWTPEYLARSAPTVSTSFKIGEKNWLSPTNKETHYETDCHYVQGTLSELVTWLREDNFTDIASTSHDTSSISADISSAKRVKISHSVSSEVSTDVSESGTTLSCYPPSDYWVYCDYKYMFQLFEDTPSLLSSLDWSGLGFEKRDGKHSTIWIGSELAHTPCHYDTYGYNIVAQLYGRKCWYLVAPSEHDKMYATRFPYEESSVFSPVNMMYPDYSIYPKFKGARVQQVVVEPGDVLFVPKHWWHFVICLETAVSVNTWIELENDSEDRLREAYVRIMVFSLKGCDLDTSLWLNPKEEYSLMEDNYSYLENAMKEISAKSKQQNSDQNEKVKDILLLILTQKNVVDFISQELLAAITKDK
ncbi:HSPB1-associated protein 1-like [Oopsacas minuta]|uniref:HSPB1-associated protein 1-like n=1 Tax=Oopsacas minuta TaxID=111878 RepID=A0AAV7JPY4_9METZ|nr:HSPB1-associated protein 1-like [Oopsacas minuta]